MLDSGIRSVYSPLLSQNTLGRVKRQGGDKTANQTVDSGFGSAHSPALSQSSSGGVKQQADENILPGVDSGLGSSMKRQ